MSGPSIVQTTTTVRFTWDYDVRRPKLRALYEKGIAAQWNAATDIDWSTGLHFGAPLQDVGGRRPPPGCPVPAELWNSYRWEYHSWLTSQFLHGEQGALLATSRLVETTPDIDDKLYAASQVTDEARHVEAFSRYVQMLGSSYPINPSLHAMLANIVSDSRWDVTYLGMQIIVEGLALAIFRLGHAVVFDPVIRQITRLVARDEARHVAFGVLALEGFYTELSSRELAEREDFIKESALLMSRRFRLEEIWERLDVDVALGVAYATTDPVMRDFRRLMFAKILGNLARLGLLTDGLRAHFEQLSLVRTTAQR